VPNFEARADSGLVGAAPVLSFAPVAAVPTLEAPSFEAVAVVYAVVGGSILPVFVVSLSFLN
jgi:hypothetical protein